MTNALRDKRILVTGGTGSIGSEIVRRALQYEPRVVRVFDNNEDEQFNLHQELRGYSNVRFLLGDVRDKERLRRAAEGVDIVFHAAALKHVPFCEYNPFEAIKTNVLGTENLIDIAMEEEVEKFIAISTDKAVNPVSVMGATKLLAERLTISANYYKGPRKTAFSCARFGNVLDSRGSVVPLFREQIKRGGPVIVTDLEMTRFVMGMSAAIDFILKVVESAKGGEIFIPRMPVLRVGDLVEVMIGELAPKYGFSPDSVRIEITGTRAGEKKHEELMTKDEAMRAYEDKEMFIILQEKRQGLGKELKVFTSQETTMLTKEEIRVLVHERKTT